MLIALAFSVLSQAQTSGGFLTWTDFNYENYRTPRLSLGGDVGIRGLISDPVWTQIYLRPSVNYRIDPTVSMSGKVSIHQSFNRDISDQFEFRLAQELNLTWPRWEVVSINHRLRMEERHFSYSDPPEGLDSPDDIWTFRLRYQVKGKSEYFNLGSAIKNLYLLSSLEYFVPVGNEGQELFASNARIMVGLGHLIPSSWKLELRFLWQQSNNRTDNSFETQNYILRLRVYYLKAYQK